MTEIKIINEVKSKSWFPWVVIGIVAIIIIWLLSIFSSKCNPPAKNTHAQEKVNIDSMVDAQLKEKKLEYERKVNFLGAAFDSLHRENEIRKQENVKLRSQIFVSENKIIELITRGRELRSSNDLPDFDLNYDSLRSEIGNLFVHINEQDFRQQQIVNNCEMMVQNRDSVIKIGEIRISGLEHALDTTRKGYDHLYVDYGAVIKKANKGQTKQKVLAGFALAELVYIIIDAAIPHK